MESAEDARDQMREALTSSSEKTLTECENSRKMEQLLLSTNKELQTQNIVLTHKAEELQEENAMQKKELQELRKEKAALDPLNEALKEKEKETGELSKLLAEQKEHVTEMEDRYDKVFLANIEF